MDYVTLTFDLDFRGQPRYHRGHANTKFCDPRSNGSPVGVMQALCVGVLKQRNTEIKKLCEKYTMYLNICKQMLNGCGSNFVLIEPKNMYTALTTILEGGEGER